MFFRPRYSQLATIERYVIQAQRVRKRSAILHEEELFFGLSSSDKRERYLEHDISESFPEISFFVPNQAHRFHFPTLFEVLPYLFFFCLYGTLRINRRKSFKILVGNRKDIEREIPDKDRSRIIKLSFSGCEIDSDMEVVKHPIVGGKRLLGICFVREDNVGIARFSLVVELLTDE